MATPYNSSSNNVFTVQAETYSTQYIKLHRRLLGFHREQKWKPGHRDIDAFGQFWSLAIVNIQNNELGIIRRGQRVPISGRHGLFIPQHSLIEWSINCSHFAWDAYLSDIPAPVDLPDSPIAFPLSTNPNPLQPNDIFKTIRDATNSFAIGKIEQSSPVAKKTKALIDKGFMEKIPIATVANELGYTHAAMTRSFKKAYGITPVAYRNKMRIFDSLGLMMMYGQSVHLAAQAVGYSEVSQYNRQFRKQNQTVPSQYTT